MPGRPVLWRRGRVAVVLGVALPLAGMAASAAPASPQDPPQDPSRGDWRRYVLAPATRHVAPVRVVGASAGVRDPAALLARDGRTARLERRLLRGRTRWPAGTTATASSALPRHPAAAAVDGDPDTWWQDGTPARRPDTLTIRAPRPLGLPGVTLVSSSRGWVLDAVVEVRVGDRWVRAGSVRDAGTLTVAVPFAAPATTDRVRVRILRAWANGGFPLRQREHARLVEVVPGLLGDAHVDLDFGRVVAGRLEVTTARASSPAPGVRLTVSELRRDLGPRSDYSHSDYGPDLAAGGGDEGAGTDQLRPPRAGGTWVDRKGCQAGRKLCAEGVRGFRYARVYLGVAERDGGSAAQLGSVDVDQVAVRFTPFLGTPDRYTGWFLSSDDLLNRAWYASVYTAELVTDTFAADSVDPRGCAQPDFEGRRVYLDGAKRDRCPYGGGADVAMQTSYVAHPDPAPITNQLHLFAAHQAADGWIPGSPLKGFGIRYPDAPGRWVTELYRYALWSGDLGFVRDHWDSLVRVLDVWYPRGIAGPATSAPGLFLGSLSLSAEAVAALDDAADLAVALGHPYAAKAAAWRARAKAVAAAVNQHLWDPEVGAYAQSPTTPCHPQWNEATVLGGIADRTRATRVLDHLQTLALPWGNPYNDDGARCPLFGRDTSKLVYGEGGAYEALARFRLGRDAEAIDQLRRTYGWQLDRDPGTVWEGWGAPGGDPSGLFGRYFTSMAHGHMAGAAFVLTNAVLGVTPTGFGFERFDVVPHPGDLAWASGVVPTPKGAVRAAWRAGQGGRFELTVTSPPGTAARIGVPTGGRPVEVRVGGAVAWDGRRGLRHRADDDGRAVSLHDLPPGTHEIVAVPLRAAPRRRAVAGG